MLSSFHMIIGHCDISFIFKFLPVQVFASFFFWYKVVEYKCNFVSCIGRIMVKSKL